LVVTCSPDAGASWITIVAAAAEDAAYADWVEVSGASGSSALTVPGEPGLLEARYHLRLPEGGSRIIGRSEACRSPLPDALLSAPAEVTAGSTFEVGWTGPGGERDYITIVPAGAPEGAWLDYAYTANGNPAQITTPVEPGQYELRYGTDKHGDLILASQPIEVTAAAVTLDAPASVSAGSSFQVFWTGPDGPQEYITIVPAGAPEGTWRDYAYTATGNPVIIQAPDEAGAYEIRYASDHVSGTFASRPIRVE
jgi:Ca-activated chloride channel family protein